MSATQPKQRVVPLGDALQPTIDRMKAIAAQSSDALLTEGPVHPDHQLLDACSEAMHLFKQAKAARTERHAASLEQASVRGCGGNWIAAGAWAGPEGGVAARRTSPGTGRQT